MSNMENMDRPIEPMGHINPDVPPLTEKRNVFHPNAHPTDKAAEEDPEKVLSEGYATEKFDDERRGSTFAGEMEEPEFEKQDDNVVTVDPFVPFNDLPDERHWIVTVRAMVVGCICGALVNASNLYLGLKTGWTFSANLFGAIVGFAVIKAVAKALPSTFPILGGDFGPRENNIVQTAATASGGLASVFVSGIPALYRLGLLSPQPSEDFPKLLTLTIVGGYFGFAFATPLRKFFIIYVARELRLIFPTPSATAMTIRSMHGAVSGEIIAKMKMKALSIAFIISFLLRVVSQYAIGILWDWHIFTWFYIWGNYNNSALAVESWGWFIEWTPAFIGSGILVGLNTSISFFMGSVLAWGIIGPALVTSGASWGYSYATIFGFEPGTQDYERWYPMTNFFSLGTAASTADSFSPRFWMLWPGVLLMIAVSFTELALQYKVFVYVTKAIWRALNAWAASVLKMMGKPSRRMEERGAQEQGVLVEDIYGQDQLVQWWMWFPLLVLMIILFCVVLAVQFDLPVGMAVLSLFLAFFFSFLAVQCAGVTDITPLTAASKASQIVLGGATKGQNWPVKHAQRLNLIGGSLASMGANQASDLVSDFRTGFLLRTSPRQQWLAQGIGTIVSVFMAPGLFILFTKAYPCVLSDDAPPGCPFSGPSIAAWEAVTVAITDKSFPVPKSSGIFAIVLSVFGSMMIIFRHYFYRGRFEKYRIYHPNMMCIGLAFVLPATVYGTAMLIGSTWAYFWARRSPRKFDIYGYAVAAGMIAGEGIGGFINAVFQIANIGGPVPYGTQIACPVLSC